MIKFDLNADREKMVSERPWVIFDHYLIVSMDFEVHTVRSNNEQNLGIGSFPRPWKGLL